MPETPMQRAHARIAIDYCTFKLVPAIFRLLMQSESMYAAESMLLNVLRDLSARLTAASSAGPFWFGSQFTLVEVAFFPWLDRYCGT